jgi:VanZ family protein
MRWWLAAAVFWTLAIMAACWLPLPMFPGGSGGERASRIPHIDKVVHASIFAVFGVLWLRAISGRWRFLVVILAGAALAAVTELAQNLPIVGRDGELGDGLCDVVGVLISYPLAAFLFRRLEVEEPVAVATGA